ncbi:HD domain-containing protein [Persephonella sp. IF05-L8]|uniref:HD domain-containing protein n=1 Tax=Persephonella sp. IF05-L8 TaxID=1158338 RepID=UPI0009DD2934
MHKSFLEKLGKQEFFTEFNDISLLKFTAFFHDVGKISTAKQEFKGHDIKGKEIILNSINKKLSLGKKASEFIGNLVGSHLEIFRLLALKEADNLTNKELNFFWFRNKNLIPHLFILAYADAYATSENKEYLKKLELFVIFLQEYYFDIYIKEIVEQPLLNGKEIMEILGIKPSPIVGKIKEKLQNKQIEGKIKTKQQAIEFIKELYYNTAT